MKLITLLLSCFLFFFQTTEAQDISGSWNGTLKVMGNELHLVFHIKDSAGTLSATMDSPDQNATDIPASRITFQPPDIHIEIGHGAIVYNGKLINSDSIQGTFHQNGLSLPLTLYRGGYTLNRPQTPQPPFPYTTKEIHFQNPKAAIRLGGTLTLPREGDKFPAVILISSSGPQDRDETILGHKPFLVIADYLTRQGLAVLRFDKRGIAESDGDYSTATTVDFASDVEAAVAFLKQRKDMNPQKIGLIGHSEGGIIAPMVAATDTSIDFIVLLAAPGVPGNRLLLMQNKALGKAAGMSPKRLAQNEQINRAVYQIVMKGGKDSVIKQKLRKKLLEAVPSGLSETQKEKYISGNIKELMSPWFHYFLQNDPARYLKNVRCPVLALDGSKDLQVPAEKNISAIKTALKKGGDQSVTTKIFPGLNHLFQDATTGLPNEYGKIAETFSPAVLKYLGDWIAQQVN